MAYTNFRDEMVEKAEENFKNIKESIKGLYDILNICLPDEQIYMEAGKENIEGLYKNLIELILNDYGLRKVVKKIQNAELDVNITLDELVVEEEL
ncbi:MAG: hypothetical protein ACFFFB_10680 [Candidatus Heimdallarchaeota archaeon]